MNIDNSAVFFFFPLQAPGHVASMLRSFPACWCSYCTVSSISRNLGSDRHIRGREYAIGPHHVKFVTLQLLAIVFTRPLRISDPKKSEKVSS